MPQQTPSGGGQAVPQSDMPSQYSALSDNTGENVLAGAGKVFHDLYQGIKQRGAQAQDWATKGTPFATHNSAAMQTAIDQDRQTDKELATSRAGQAGGLLANAALMLAAPEGMAGAAAGGAALGAAQPTSGDESALGNTALGAAGGAIGQGVGQLAGKAIGRVIQPFRNAGSPQMDADVLRMASEGIPMNAAQNLGYGSKAITQEQKEAFSQAVLKHIGVDSETADPATMTAARGTMGTTFDALAARNPIKVDPTLIGHLSAIEASAAKELNPDQMKVLQNQIDNIHINGASNQGTIPGTAFTNMRQVLARLQTDQTQPVRNFWLDEVEGSLHSAMSRSAQPGDAALLNNTKQQWRMLKQVEPSLDSQNYVSPSALYQTMDKVKNANQSIYGQGPQSLMSLAQAGKNVMTNSRPDNFYNASRLMAYGQIAATLGGAEEMMRGNVKGAGALIGIAGGKALLETATQNPKLGAMLGGWAKSQVLSSWRKTIGDSATRLGGQVGGSVVPTAGEQNGLPGQPSSGP
jgi:hypothetical protein